MQGCDTFVLKMRMKIKSVSTMEVPKVSNVISVLIREIVTSLIDHYKPNFNTLTAHTKGNKGK